jgi:hypothetical protein
MLTAVEEIESAILRLSPKELGQLTEWVLDLDEQNWDKQIERDGAAGKLDFLKEEALAELESGDRSILASRVGTAHQLRFTLFLPNKYLCLPNYCYSYQSKKMYPLD